MPHAANVRMDRSSWTLGDVGCVGALLSVLAFQSLQHDPFEAEKLGILLLCSVLMLVNLLATPYEILRRWRTNPLILAVTALALVTLVSSGVALSPARAFFGSGFRSYGWIVIGCQTILVLYAATYGARLRALIPRVIMLIAVPLCLFALYQSRTDDTLLRPGSTTGNPNYLAAWLGLCLMWVLPGALSLRVSSWRSWLMPCLWGLLILWTLNLTASRAAFIGIFIAGFAGVILWGALRRNVIPFVGVGVLSLVLAALLGIVQSGLASQQGLARLLEPVDDFRQAAWTDSLSMAQQMAVPLIDVSQQPDRWASLRPFVGYGLDNLDNLEVRTYELRGVTAATSIIDRMHSLLYDTLFSTGVAGLIAEGLLFEAIWLSLLASLHLLNSRRDLVICAGLQVMSAVGIGLIGQALGWTLGVSLVLSLLGLIIGLLLWLALTTWRSRTPSTPISSWLIGLWCASLFYFICHLFGFQNLTGSILFSALIGFCALDSTDETLPAPQIDTLCLVLAIATVFVSSLLRSVEPLSLILMTGGLIAAGAALIWLDSVSSSPRKRVSNSWRDVLIYGGGLVFLTMSVYAARVQLSLSLNQTLLEAPNSSLSTLMLQASGHGWLTLLCYTYAGVLLWRAGQPRMIPESRSLRLIVIVGLIAASLAMVANATGHILWNTASALDSISGAHYAAEQAYEGAEIALPWVLELRLEHLGFLRSETGASLGVDTQPLEESIRALNPFVNNQVRDP